MGVGRIYVASDGGHIIAESKGGTHHLDNLQPLCGYCNSLKRDRHMEYLDPVG